jgi:hypothetical protein
MEKYLADGGVTTWLGSRVGCCVESWWETRAYKIGERYSTNCFSGVLYVDVVMYK